MITVLEVLDRLEQHFDPATWSIWRVFLKALFGLEMTDPEREAFTRYTGRVTPPTTPAREAWAIVGRRGGKSRMAALVAVFLACFRDYTPILAPGEQAEVLIIAVDKRQAGVVLRYVLGLLRTTRLGDLIVGRPTRDAVMLRNRVVIRVQTNSFRLSRGYTVVAAVCDEIAYWRSEESAIPDVEVLTALRPAMATVRDRLLLCISSPYARRGALWDAYSKHFGKDGDPVLVWQADTRSMNPSVDPEVVAEAYERDDVAAAAEYGAEFRRDVEGFVTREAVEACVVPGRHELPPAVGLRYIAFTDLAGGGADSYTLAIAHREGDWIRGDWTLVLDALRERRPPCSLEAVAGEFADLCKAYGLSRVQGDRYAGEWPREQFRKRGVTFELTERAKSDIYAGLLPLVNSRRVELLAHPRLLAQLMGLERRTARGGRDSIDHGPHGHDDLINAAAGALTLAAAGSLVAVSARIEPEAARPRESPTFGTMVAHRPLWRRASVVDRVVARATEES